MNFAPPHDRVLVRRIEGEDKTKGRSIIPGEREGKARPVDVEGLGAQVSRPEVATEVYLAALMAVDIETEAERDYFRRLTKALRLDAEVVSRLHRMTGTPSVEPTSA